MEVVLKKEIILNRQLCKIFCVLTFVVLTAFGAFVRIPLPFTPVPITLQTFFVLLSGALLGSGLGVFTQMSYIILGIFGMPIFTQAGSGWNYLLGPTGGYVFGFLLAVFWLGSLIKHGRDSLTRTFLIFCLGDIILLSCGTLWLKLLFGLSVTKALFIGFLPFIPADLVKALLAATIYLRLKNRIKEVL